MARLKVVIRVNRRFRDGRKTKRRFGETSEELKGGSYGAYGQEDRTAGELRAQGLLGYGKSNAQRALLTASADFFEGCGAPKRPKASKNADADFFEGCGAPKRPKASKNADVGVDPADLCSCREAGGSAQPVNEGVGGHRSRDVVALGFLAVERFEGIERFLVLNPLSDHGRGEVVGQADR